jgi:hypothetical protein
VPVPVETIDVDDEICVPVVGPVGPVGPVVGELLVSSIGTEIISV